MVSFSKSYQYDQIGRLHQAASRTITSCLSSSPLPLLLYEATLPPLQATLTNFALSSYERALCRSTSFPISGVARFGKKPRLRKYPWRAFAFTHLLMLPSASPRKVLFACPPLPSFLHCGVQSFFSMLPL